MGNFGYYKVVVKILIEEALDNGNIKTKKSQEVYLIEAGSPQDAADRAMKEMEGCMGEYRIDSIKEVKLTSIIMM